MYAHYKVQIESEKTFIDAHHYGIGVSSERVGYIIRPLPEELEADKMEIRYNAATDYYERPVLDNQPSDMMGWTALASNFVNVSRKIENDWRMVYLARREGSPAEEPGLLEWIIDLTETDRSVLDVKVMTCGAEFESGKVRFTLCSDKGVCCDLCGFFTDPKEVFKGSRKLTLRAEMSGGQGERAWQHAQIFRQKSNDAKLYPLNIIVNFQKD